MRTSFCLLSMLALACTEPCLAKAALPASLVPPPPPTVLVRPAPSPAVVSTPSTPARSGPGAALPQFHLAYLITARDFPPEARKRRHQGEVVFSLEVGTDGRVTACRIDASSGHAVLDSTTCVLATRRARFDPAIDAEGRPVVGSYVGRIEWDLTKLRDTPLPGTITRQFEVGVDGRISKCRIIKVTGSAARQFRIGPEPCRTTRFDRDNDTEEPHKRKVVTEVETIVVTPAPATP